jgi:hypothetical protein
MNSTYTIIVVLAILLITGVILASIFSRRNRTKRLQGKFGAEYDLTMQALGDEKKAHTELEGRQKHVASLDIHPLSAEEGERYTADWIAVQSQFVDDPGKAIVDADQLIMEVMHLRNYPISDFEQRAADVSVIYPELVSNYRAAREIAIKNEQQQADTEELRQALIYYRSLFDELLETEPVIEPAVELAVE